MLLRKIASIFTFILGFNTFGAQILIPMDNGQKNHMKAYGIAYWVLENGVEN